ncbi:ROK family transcriptional regulator [uncultured Pseudokineococcus sp.]|uniref:ROK family transcriptional regulator n=1 Tax=uncultured Pseudokineococcus sp. TaxID=1642928 RepID=UPI0026377BFB|nr:ROK family transcriptional regulator [uncultured Pseudokineococcus sp.]
MAQQTPAAGTAEAVPPPAGAPASRSGAARPRPAVAGVGDLFQHLRDGRARTRAELAETTGLSRSSIASRVDRLLESGLVAAVGEAVSTGGRPPARFAFAPGSRVVLGADLGVTHGVVELTDLAGEVLAAHAAPLRIADGPEPVLEWVVRTASHLLERAGRGPEELVGTGIGLPGPVDHGSGRPVRPPIMPGWDDADVRGLVGAHLPGVVLADNDVNLMALGEHVHAWRGADHLLVVKVSTGIGLGIISGGRLDRGARGAAGDLGHVQVPGRDDAPCACGHTGCLEAVAGGGALARALAADGARVEGVGDVVELVRGGDARAVAAVRTAGRDLGRVLATCVNILNPSVVVLGGSLAEVDEHLLAGVREVVYARSLPLATADLRVVRSQMGDRAAVAGASAMVAEHALSPEGVDAACG